MIAYSNPRVCALIVHEAFPPVGISHKRIMHAVNNGPDRLTSSEMRSRAEGTSEVDSIWTRDLLVRNVSIGKQSGRIGSFTSGIEWAAVPQKRETVRMALHRRDADSFHNPDGKALGVLQQLFSNMTIEHLFHPW